MSLSIVVEAQLQSLEDTDPYASVWREALQAQQGRWGGRGRGGRGAARKTFQPKDIVVDPVDLEYVGGRSLLHDATLKLLSGKIYALIGRNGQGKSTLLRRVESKGIPGFPPHIRCLYLPQEVGSDLLARDDMTLPDFVLSKCREYETKVSRGCEMSIEKLEEAIEALDMEHEESEAEMNRLSEAISELDDEARAVGVNFYHVEQALESWGISHTLWDTPMAQLSAGLCKKALLCLVSLCSADLVLLDEPTSFLDIHSLLHLRSVLEECSERQATVLMISHDVDLINSCATDVMELTEQQLHYYPGNYSNYLVYKRQNNLHQLRQAVRLNKQREAMMQTLDNLKKQPTPKRSGGRRKKGKQVESQKKKIERLGLVKDEHGHRWTQQKAGSGIKAGSINAVDASTKKGLSLQARLKLTEQSIMSPPDKAVQFVFRQPTSEWGEPLVLASNLGFKPENLTMGVFLEDSFPVHDSAVTRKEGFLFDSMDLCIDEGGRYCILGSTACGKSALLRILSGNLAPSEGKIRSALNVDVAFIDQEGVERLITEGLSDGACDALTFLARRYPEHSNQDIRGELTSFGLNASQASQNLAFLSGGERARLSLACAMLADPQVLIWDDPTANLDVESVEALTHGLKQWKGTFVCSSHDANFVRSVDAECYVLVAEEGKLRRLRQGIDEYIRFFS